MKRFIALLMEEKQLKMNGKMMTPTFFELYPEINRIRKSYQNIGIT